MDAFEIGVTEDEADEDDDIEEADEEEDDEAGCNSAEGNESVLELVVVVIALG